ncbi:hypothetical protein DPMN_040469 [Dreissena polymorpha]|nr:hypothetical protein DPMN_040469 [Dreissena polymorpha]
MHTDAGGVKNIGFGATHPLGHVDFYPNGGERQPGCAADAVDKLGATSWAALSTFFNVYAAEEALACSHERSYYYFTESINSQCPFTAWKCATLGEFDQGHCVKCTDDSCARMGYHADPSKGLRGNFYLNTESTDSFCQYTYQVNISSLNNFDGILYMTLEGTNATIGPTALMKNNLVHLGKDTLALRYHSRVNVGSPTHLTLRYEKITTPFISSSYPDDWHLLGVTLWQADESRKYSFCNTYHAEIDNHNSTTFSVRGVTC